MLLRQIHMKRAAPMQAGLLIKRMMASDLGAGSQLAVLVLLILLGARSSGTVLQLGLIGLG
ncbi:hypothetical protein [Halomonas sp. Y3]|uniref:hypothetical protein n=1 Tax=Halomonas sp. Y3 TaxID=2956797 RepID=UPI00209C821E|nr:hypothetical protein [Halomonas sp. Y3]